MNLLLGLVNLSLGSLNVYMFVQFGGPSTLAVGFFGLGVGAMCLYKAYRESNPVVTFSDRF